MPQVPHGDPEIMQYPIIRSSIQIYILNNYKRINLNDLKREEMNIYN